MTSLQIRLLSTVGAIFAGLALAAAAVAVTSRLQSNEDAATKHPCEGLSDEACKEVLNESEAQFRTDMDAWIKDINNRDIDFRSLETADLNLAYGPPEESLESAVEAADVAILGTAESITFDSEWGFSRVSVKQTLKGDTPEEITIQQPGGPRPYPDWDSMILGSSQAEPLLLPGDQALLFLTFNEASKNYEVQPSTGMYRVTDGKASALSVNPFAESVTDVPVSNLLSTVESLAVAD